MRESQARVHARRISTDTLRPRISIWSSKDGEAERRRLQVLTLTITVPSFHIMPTTALRSTTCTCPVARCAGQPLQGPSLAKAASAARSHCTTAFTKTLRQSLRLPDKVHKHEKSPRRRIKQCSTSRLTVQRAIKINVFNHNPIKKPTQRSNPFLPPAQRSPGTTSNPNPPLSFCTTSA